MQTRGHCELLTTPEAVLKASPNQTELNLPLKDQPVRSRSCPGLVPGPAWRGGATKSDATNQSRKDSARAVPPAGHSFTAPHFSARNWLRGMRSSWSTIFSTASTKVLGPQA